jgi:hypothetical protein
MNYQSFSGTTPAALQARCATVEQETTVTRALTCGLVPGLLQTREYARAVFKRFDHLVGPFDIDAAVEGRLKRQEVLLDDSRSFDYILTNAAVMSPLGPPEMMRAQIKALLGVLELPNVRLGIIPPWTSVVLPVMHSFVISDRRAVTIEFLNGTIDLTDPEEVRLYHEAFARFETMACFGEQARPLLKEAISSLS